MRAPTPTAAAEIAVPVREELIAQLAEAALRQRSQRRSFRACSGSWPAWSVDADGGVPDDPDERRRSDWRPELLGGRLVVRPALDASFPAEDNVIAGNSFSVKIFGVDFFRDRLTLTQFPRTIVANNTFELDVVQLRAADADVPGAV